MSDRLSNPSEGMHDEYRTVVVGSGYGGAITAARLAEMGQPVCVLERGKEWHAGDFPDSIMALAGNVRKKTNPLGLVDYYLCKDIDVLKGNGLGGTSLINAGIALRPDRELFADQRWPKFYRDLAASGTIWDDYARAEQMLGVGPHPRAAELTKVEMVRRRADQLTGAKFWTVNAAVNHEPEGLNRFGVHQRPCIDCGDCVTGCNVGAKNTLNMNYLPYAKQKGAEIYTQVEVRHIEKDASGYSICYRVNGADTLGELKRLRAANVILAAGALGSTEILLRSAGLGLKASRRLGHGFSGNGDSLGLA